MNMLLLSLLLSLAPTAQDPVPASAPAPAAQDEAAKPADELAPYNELAVALQEAIEAGEGKALASCVDLDALMTKATSGVEVDAGFRKGFESGVKSTLLKSFGDSLQAALEQGGELRLLRVRTYDKQHRLLFRLLIPEGGVDYIEFSTKKSRSGRLRIDDWYQYATGEWVSETLHHLYLPFAMQQQRGLVDRLLGKDQLLVKHWEKVSQLIACVQQADLERGLEVYAELPEELRHDKFILLQRLRLLVSNTEHADYMRVLEDLRRYCPGDPSNELHAIDFHYLRKDWARAAEAVRRLREAVGGDAYLDYLESTVLIMAEDWPAARKAVEKAIEIEPGYLDAHWTLVTIGLKQKDHAAVLAALKRIDEHFEVEWNDLSGAEEYKDFVAAPQGAEWKSYLASKH